MTGKDAEASKSEDLVLSCHALSYTVEVGFRKKKEKKILQDVYGVYKPGLNAIMGPSGSGKTSLLDLLANRKDVLKRELSGQLLLNGNPFPANYHIISGYVVQDDVVTGSLTVRENLMFAANMRLKSEMGSEEKQRIVNDLLDELLLQKCANSKVGTELIKGVSGGERKRCNIGMELVVGPKILFLDEPTTGLDSSTSLSVMKILHRLAVHGNRTIIFSIHQPRYTIYKNFDNLHLLTCYGQTAFHGPTSKAVDYFSAQGLPCESFNNPADFFLDCVLKHNSVRFSNDPNTLSKTQDSQDVEKDRSLNVDEEFFNVAEKAKIDLAKSFSESEENKNLKEECGSLLSPGNPKSKSDQFGEWHASSWIEQFFYLSVRAFTNYARNPQVSFIELGTMAFLAVLCGIVFWDIEHDTAGFQNIYGALFFMTAQMMWTNLQSVETFIKDRNMFLHELANGYYRPSSFFFAKLATDLFPRRLFPTLIFVVIFYWMAGLAADVDKFFFALFACLTATMASCGLAFFIGIVVGQFAVASSLLTLCYITFMIFGGLMMNVKDLKVWIRWFSWVSITRQSLAPLIASQVKDIDFCGPRTFQLDGIMYEDTVTCEKGTDLLEQQGINYGAKDQWLGMMILFTYIAAVFALTYLKIITMKKQK